MWPGAGRFVPPMRRGCGSGLSVTAPPYRRIPRQIKEVPMEQLIEDVLDPQKRGLALIHLAMKRKAVPDFSLTIWRTPAIIVLILQEILKIYPYMDHQEQLPDDDCHRVSCAIALFQPLAMDDRLRTDFLKAEMPQYLYPFLKNLRQSASYEKLRLTSLGIIGFLVKKLDIVAVKYLLGTEIVPLCLCCMEVGTNLSKTVAVFILEKILSTEIGQKYICGNRDRFLVINHMLASMFILPHEKSSSRLLKSVIICFYLFSCNPSMSETLYNILPDAIKDGSCFHMFQDDEETLNCVYQLLWNSTGGQLN